MKEEKTEEKAGEKSEGHEQEGIHKIAITKEAERALSDVVDKVNDGYQGGRASRMGVASWIIMQFTKAIGAQDIRAMRLEFLNEISLLELALRRAKQMGALPPEMRRLLMQQVGLMEEPLRRGAKAKVSDDAAPDAGKEAA